MTESEWLISTDPRPMLAFLRGKAGQRKLRLFACGCCRSIWHKLPYPQYRQAVELAERFADGKATADQLGVAWNAAADLANAYHEEGEDDPVGWTCAHAADPAGLDFALSCASSFCNTGSSEERMALFRSRFSPWDTDLSRHTCSLIRDIFGNPFCPDSLVWRSPYPLSLIDIYHERRFDDLPLVAESLEKAGCDNAEILNHCRGPGPHVRGCWVVDLILGKE